MILKRASLICLSLALAACAAENTRPNVVLDTTMGQIEIEVHTDTAPISGGDFLLYVDQGHYDGQGFYRVVRPETDPRDMGMSLIQGGRLDSEPLTPAIAHELTTETGLSNTRGTVSIARDAPGTGSAAYFFINIGDNSFLDYGGTRNPDGQGYASFGTVVRGMDVVEAIQAGRSDAPSEAEVTSGQILNDPVIITTAKRVR